MHLKGKEKVKWVDKIRKTKGSGKNRKTTTKRVRRTAKEQFMNASQLVFNFDGGVPVG